MQTAAKDSLIFTKHSSFKEIGSVPIATKQAGFYQQIVHGLTKGIYTNRLESLGDALAALAHYAYTLRQMEVVGQIGELLSGLPLGSYQRIGHYYQALYLKRQGRFLEAHSLLNPIVDTVPGAYKSRVILSLAGLAFDSGDHSSALPLYIEAGRAALSKSHSDLFTAIHTQKMVAVLKSIQGNHRSALADLERLLPLVRTVSKTTPTVLPDYLNSLAVELNEFGRLEEAANVSRIVLASPYLNAYPEWRETGKDISLRGYKSRSLVPIIQSFPGNVVSMPERKPSATSVHSAIFGPAPVVGLKGWKEGKMVKEPNGETEDENVDAMDDKDLLATLIQIAAREDIDEEKLRDVVKYAIKTLGMPRK
jgi:tetratricopeptide (TPR) repeat protein